jgi:hypothetical protein
VPCIQAPVSALIVGVGLFGPVVVVAALMVLDIVHVALANPGSYDDADDLAGVPRGWTLAWFCAAALAVADPLVAAIGYRAPLAILVRTALAGGLAGLVVGRALAIGRGAALFVVAMLWPVALIVGGAIHIGALWLVLTAI